MIDIIYDNFEGGDKPSDKDAQDITKMPEALLFRYAAKGNDEAIDELIRRNPELGFPTDVSE